MFGASEHWSDSAGSTDGSRQADQQHRVRVANTVLGLFSLRLRGWANRYLLTGLTGRSLVLDNLGSLWPAAEQISGRTCDPLDETVIAALERRASVGR